MNNYKALPHTLVAIQDGKYVGTHYFIVLDDDGKPFSVLLTDKQIEKLGSPTLKSVLSDGVYMALLDLAKKRKALQTGYSILKYGDNSIFTMKQKLKKHQFSDEQIEYVLEKLVSSHLLDDEKTAVNFVYRCQKKKWGPKRTYQYLVSHGIRSDDAKLAISKGRDVFDENKESLIEMYHQKEMDENEIKKELYKLGY